MITRLTLLLGLVWLFALQVSAQTITPTPVAEGFVFKWGTETIFPQGIRFTIALLRNFADLESVTLSVEVEGYDPVTEVISLDEPVSKGENLTDLAYFWLIPDEIVPRLFGTVRFEWRAVDRSGESAFVRDQMVFTDERREWIRSDDPVGFINLVVPANGVGGAQIRRSVQAAYNLISAQVGRVQALNIILYPSDLNLSGCIIKGDHQQVAVGPASGEEAPCSPDRAAQIFRASGYDVVQTVEAGMGAGSSAALIALFVRRLYAPVWAGKDVPAWLEAGLAQFFSPASKLAWLGSLRASVRSARLYSIGEMTIWPERAGDLWLSQSYAMVLYLADQLGVDGLYQLARITGANSFEAAYQNATGQRPAALIDHLRRWILTRDADLAFAYSPYLPETPTPTASATSTSTATPTPSATSTVTLTPSVTGVLSATPSSTPRPTITPTPRPPTVTPRPPGSLFTPTPTPAPSIIDDPIQRQGLLAVLFIALAVVSLLYIIAVRRSGG